MRLRPPKEDTSRSQKVKAASGQAKRAEAGGTGSRGRNRELISQVGRAAGGKTKQLVEIGQGFSPEHFHIRSTDEVKERGAPPVKLRRSKRLEELARKRGSPGS